MELRVEFIREMSPRGLRSFKSSSFVRRQRNEIVNTIFVSVFRVLPRDINRSSEKPSKRARKVRFSEMVIDLGAVRWPMARLWKWKKKCASVIAEWWLPESCCWNLSQRPMCLGRISDVMAIPLSRSMSRCEIEWSSSMRFQSQFSWRFQLRSMMNLNYSGDPFLFSSHFSVTSITQTNEWTRVSGR